MLIASILNFLSFLDTNLIIPVIALYASTLGANPAMIGIIIGLYSITNTPANIISGRWIDRTGYKLPLIVGLVGSATSMFAYSLTKLPIHLALVRITHGFCGGLKSPAIMSAFTKYSDESHSGKTMAFYGISLATANLVGFSLSGVIVSRLGYNSLFFFGTIVLAIGVLMVLLLPKAKSPEKSFLMTSYKDDFQKVKDLLRKRGLFTSYSSIFAQYFAFGGVVTLLPLYIKSLGMDAFHVGMLLTMFTIIFISLQFPSGSISDRIGRFKMISAGLILGTISLTLLPFVTAFPVLLITMALYGAAFGILFPSVSALIADYTKPEERGMATGVFHSFLTAGVAIGAPIMGGIGSLVGIKTALTLCPIILVIALLITERISYRPKYLKDQ
ncbi:MFS transporter [Chloroflexota bacterium]